jgi:2-keto-4-pentenoate hydratase/2-oxohepta-3-ene-1,7-dioic acid hydratase in catechol pathway
MIHSLEFCFPKANAFVKELPMRIYRVRDERQQIRFATSDNGRDFFALAGDPFYGERKITNERVIPSKVLVPIEPPVIYGIGLNYRKHAEENKAPVPEHPIVFLKAPSAIQDPDSPILLPRQLHSDKVDSEGELAVVIAYRCKNVKKQDALNYVLGYTAANDVSARDWQKEFGGSQWCRGKTFDTFCPLGPSLVTPDEVPNPNALHLKTRLNGEIVQESNTADMIFDVPTLIEFLSGSTTLEPGTVILTGTPSGVGMAAHPPRWLKPGDTVQIDIQTIGTLSNPVEEEKF